MLLTEDQLRGKLTHCEPTPTIVLNECLRAMRLAALAAGLDGTQIEDLFWNNARELLGRVRDS
jgi:hypothetical protein